MCLEESLCAVLEKMSTDIESPHMFDQRETHAGLQEKTAAGFRSGDSVKDR